ncbi:T9SS type A sorting domain-containing protein [candidate division KSB1 bacterium]|nr:T9SS type A sorting domain-containing protein [candidate division KSB1 bacterium]
MQRLSSRWPNRKHNSGELMPQPWRWVRFAVLCAMVLIVNAANAQSWDQLIPLTRDNYYHHGPQMIVDEALQIHLFTVRSVQEAIQQPSCLAYQRFDNWGNPLTTSVLIAPDSQRMDHWPGVLRDHHGAIHVVWWRSYDFPWWMNRFMYAKLDTAGNFLIEPRELPWSHVFPGFSQNGIHLVETNNDVIWYSDLTRFMSFDESAQVIDSLQPIVPLPDVTGYSLLALAPDQSVWTAFRHAPGDELQQVSVMRMDTSPRVPELVLSSGDPIPHQIGNGRFYIDTTGAFHHSLWSEFSGEFYARDPRDGSGGDTVNVGTEALYTSTDWILVPPDTLLFIRGIAASHLMQFNGFNFAGRRVIGPTLVTPAGVCIDPFIWKRGGYWLAQFSVRHNPTRDQIDLTHIPGPDEPPNSVADRRPTASPGTGTLTVYPQPVQSSFVIVSPTRLTGQTEILLYNLLGQRIELDQPPAVHGSDIRVVLPSSLAFGTYFVHISTPYHAWVKRIIYLKP